MTLKREMLTAIDSKIGTARGSADDLKWPGASTQNRREAADDLDGQHFWHNARERYAGESDEPSLTDVEWSKVLPAGSAVVSMHLSKDQSTLILVRQGSGSGSIVVKLPLDRMARREGEEESFTFAMAKAELVEIVERCNSSAQRAKGVAAKEDRVAWWQERKDLDARLKTLLETIEHEWLGCFKTLLLPSQPPSVDALLAFRGTVETILKRSIVRAQSKKVIRFKLNDDLVSCFASLPATTRDEDLEDCIHYLIESFQIGGVPIASDEIDVDQAICDLRTALEEMESARAREGAKKAANAAADHTFLVLDPSMHAFPVESIPCMRGRSASRIPSLAFLRDRLELVKAQAKSADALSANPHFVAKKSNTGYVLNPGGDLKNTQAFFEGWLTSTKEWTGIVARAPMEEELRSALSNKDIVLCADLSSGGVEECPH